MEGHFGITVDVMIFKEETKKKITSIRNKYIAKKDPNYTMTDIVDLAVDALYKMEAMADAQERRAQDGGSKA